MKRTIRFSRGFLPAVILSSAMVVLAIAGLAFRGFNMGVDFAAGLNETVRLAQPAMQISWTGQGVAKFEVKDNQTAQLTIAGTADAKSPSFSFKDYPTVRDLVSALNAVGVEGLVIQEVGGAEDSPSVSTSLLWPTESSNTALGADASLVHRRLTEGEERFASIEQVRLALAGIPDVSVLDQGEKGQQSYIIRVENKGLEEAKAPEAAVDETATPAEGEAAAADAVPAEGEAVAADAVPAADADPFTKRISAEVKAALDTAFGADRVVVISTKLVGSRFSKDLFQSSIWLVMLALLAILVYASIRFKPQFAIGAVLAIVHDSLAMIAFMIWSRMEFNTSSIAAILTILGFSINDTIVIFDRIRENMTLRKDEPFTQILNESLTETLSRTIITNVAALLMVIILFVFTTDTMKDFSLALIVGMLSGTYSTIFIASAFVDFWKKAVDKRNAKKEGRQVGTAKAAKPAKA